MADALLHVLGIDLERSLLSKQSPGSQVISYLGVIDRLAGRGAQAAVLGCTEIGLLVGQSDTPMPLIDSALVHALWAVDAVLPRVAR